MKDHKITVVKIGGNIVDNPEALRRFAKFFSSFEGLKVLVHGGGKEATRLSERLEIPTVMIEGRRVTSEATLDVVTMVYAGLVNKRVVSLLQKEGCNAIGLSGADGNAIKASRRNPKPIDYGFVGDINPDEVNTTLLSTLLGGGFTPVFCAITHDGSGTLLNCNADSVAAAVAIALSRVADVDLVYCFEMPGVLEDVNRPESVIPRINMESYAELKRCGVVSKGMIPKLDNSFKALGEGVGRVIIRHADDLLSESAGTILEQ